MTGVSDAVSRAAVLLGIDRHEEAARVLDERLATDPGDAAAWSFRALCHVRARQWDDAEHAAAQGVRGAPESELSYRALSLALLGSRRYEDAVAAAEECVRLAPDRWSSHATLSRVLGACPRPPSASSRPDPRERALAEALEAARLAPSEPRAHRQVAEVSGALGRGGERAEALRRVLALDPSDAEARAQLDAVALSRDRFALVKLLAVRVEALAALPDQRQQFYPVAALLHMLLRRLRVVTAVLVLVPLVVLHGFPPPTPLPVRVAALVLELPACAAFSWQIARALPRRKLRILARVGRDSALLRWTAASVLWSPLVTVVMALVPWPDLVPVYVLAGVAWVPVALAACRDHVLRHRVTPGGAGRPSAADLYG
ncbi:tetratricopeptide repeat protein [Streptomyces sp. NBC_01497]|uniref:tetratricopeptide repeat protein n=1 Tax=Streptomyces sp. NBC_01497 TaxID=2903885 RepID=UPI002E3730D6|nr:hypothetical protein [Streptomyces sp. NBC_01497]